MYVVLLCIHYLGGKTKFLKEELDAKRTVHEKSQEEKRAWKAKGDDSDWRKHPASQGGFWTSEN